MINFLFRRGRINCSLNDKNGWRWFGNSIYKSQYIRLNFFNFLLVGRIDALSKSVNLFCSINFFKILVYSFPVSAYLSKYLTNSRLSKVFGYPLSSALAILNSL